VRPATAFVASVVAIALVAACKKDTSDRVPEVKEVEDVADPAPGPPPDPRPIGALLLEAQRRSAGFVPSRVMIDYVGSDGIMDPSYARLEVWYGTTRPGVTDDPNRRTGAPVVAPPPKAVTQCPRLTWQKGIWTTRLTGCPAAVMVLQCSVAIIWDKAIAHGAQRDAVARIGISALPAGSTSQPSWRIEIDDGPRNVHFHESYADDCGVVAELPDPSVATDQVVPEDLDRTMIQNGVGVVLPTIKSCGERSTVKGMVKITVKVAPDGSVTTALVKQSPEPVLGNCVARVLGAAKFTRTRSGGSFSYPFVF
jgi:hypothetical protein